MPEGISLLDLPQAALAEIEGGQFVYMVTPEGQPFKVDIAELVGRMQQEAGCLCLRVAKLDIPSAEVLTLNTTPKGFGLNVPVGYYANMQAVAFSLQFNTTAYATNTNIVVANQVGTGLLAAGTDVQQFSIPATQANANINAGGDFFVTVQSGDPTAGDSDITLYLTYVLIPL
jgi:hypothetical protein